MVRSESKRSPRWFMSQTKVRALLNLASCSCQYVPLHLTLNQSRTGLGPITNNQINYNYSYFQLFSSITITLLKLSNQLQLHYFNYNYICIMQDHLLIM